MNPLDTRWVSSSCPCHKCNIATFKYENGKLLLPLLQLSLNKTTSVRLKAPHLLSNQNNQEIIFQNSNSKQEPSNPRKRKSPKSLYTHKIHRSMRDFRSFLDSWIFSKYKRKLLSNYIEHKVQLSIYWHLIVINCATFCSKSPITHNMLSLIAVHKTHVCLHTYTHIHNTHFPKTSYYISFFFIKMEIKTAIRS